MLTSNTGIIGMEQVIKKFGVLVVDESDSQMDLT
jgi:hypothetical protein